MITFTKGITYVQQKRLPRSHVLRCVPTSYPDVAIPDQFENLRPPLIRLGGTPNCTRRLCCKSGQQHPVQCSAAAAWAEWSWCWRRLLECWWWCWGETMARPGQVFVGDSKLQHSLRCLCARVTRGSEVANLFHLSMWHLIGPGILSIYPKAIWWK